MNKKDKVAIIIPCYNEVLRLRPEIFAGYLKDHKLIDFLFVNDGSTDKTFDILNQLYQANRLRIYLINQPNNTGKAEVVRSGFLKAIPMGYRYIGYWDADLATPLNAINQFCSILASENIKLVMGSRVKILGKKINRRKYRHYAGRFFATIASAVLNLPVYDTQCGAKIFKNEKSLHHIFKSPFTVNWTFDVEMIARFIKIYGNSRAVLDANAIVEFPLDKWTDQAGSKLKFYDGWIAFFELMKIYASMKQNR